MELTQNNLQAQFKPIIYNKNIVLSVQKLIFINPKRHIASLISI